MDNARLHKTEGIVIFIKDHGIVILFFPPYSPELNRIENTFRRMKNIISFNNLNSKELKEIIIEQIKIL